MLTKVERIVASETDPELAAGVVINGITLPADFVIMGVGVAPATGFLKGSGIEIEKDGGVRVDKFMRVKTGKDTKHVYAIGASDSRIHNEINKDIMNEYQVTSLSILLLTKRR